MYMDESITSGIVSELEHDGDLDLSSYGILVTIRCKAWKGIKLDKRAEAAARDAMGATWEGRYTKSLVKRTRGKANPHTISVISGHITKVRRYMDSIGCKWENDGTYLVPSGVAEEVLLHLEDMRDQFYAAVETYIVNGYTVDREAARLEQGELFNDEDYPHPDALRERFAMDYEVGTIPSATELGGNLITKMSGKLVSRIVKKASRLVEDRMRSGFAQIVKRLSSSMTEFARIMNSPNPVRQDSLENLRRELELIPRLNSWGNEALNDAARAMLDALGTLSADSLKANNVTAGKVQAATAETIQKLESVMVGYI